MNKNYEQTEERPVTAHEQLSPKEREKLLRKKSWLVRTVGRLIQTMKGKKGDPQDKRPVPTR